jgi:phospholipid/cholesterol/gamma-HCH transport system substrate-binding protein
MNIFGKIPIVNNQTKVGLFALITVIIFIFGFYFLKGINLFTTKSKYYAVFDNVDGIYKSNPVVVNGHHIGSVNAEAFDPITGKVVLEMVIDNDFVLYDSCFASITSTDLVGSKEVSIRYKISPKAYKSGDTISSFVAPDLMSKLSGAIDPLKDNISRTLKNLDSVLYAVKGALAKDDQTSTIHKLNATLDNIHTLTSKGGSLDQTLANLKSFTGNLDKNNEKINHLLANVADLTDTLKNADLGATVSRARSAISGIDTLLHGINNGEGTIGSLIKDKKVYNDLDSAVSSLNVLLVDVKAHPFRYVNVSVFGGEKRDAKYKAKLAKEEAKKKGKTTTK